MIILNFMARKLQYISAPHPLVAIDLGSHSIRSMAADFTPDGLLYVRGVEISKKKIDIERGVIMQTSSTSYHINENMKFLGNRIQRPQLNNAFVPVGGRSMKVVEVASRRDQGNKREVSAQLLEEMKVECKQKIEARNQQVAVLDLIPYAYVLDGIAQNYSPSPEQRATKIEAKYAAFVGKKELEQKVDDSFIRTPILPEQKYARPDVLFCALASEEDLEQGCAILDMGAQTTTLTVFKDGKYVYNRVLSQGGYDITRDIEQWGMPFAYAERLKGMYGSVCAEEVVDGRCFRVPSNSTAEGVVLLRAGDLQSTIKARLEQIVTPLMNDLRQYESEIGVLYITGGASLLNGMEQYVQSMTTVPVTYGSHAHWLTEDVDEEYLKPTYSSMVGTLILAAFYREEHPYADPVGGLKKRFEEVAKDAQTTLIGIFSE